MKPVTRKVVNYLMLSGLLLQSVSPVMAVATTVEENSTETSTSATTQESSQTVDSTQVSTTEESSQEKAPVIPTEVEKTYDERELKDTDDPDSSHPVIQVEEKKLEERFSIKGKVTAKLVEEGALRYKTYLKSILLQKRTKDNEWETIDKIELKKNHENDLNTEGVSFDFFDDRDESAEYRLVLDYDISKYEYNELLDIKSHKAHFSIKKVQKKNSQIANSLEEKDQQLFGLSRGISPLSNSYNHEGSEHENYVNYVRISNITKDSGAVSFCSSLQSAGSRTQPAYAIVHTDPEFIRNINGIHPQINNSKWTTVKQNALKIIRTPTYNVTMAYWTQDPVLIDGLTPNTDYYIWLVYLRNVGLTTEFAQHLVFAGLTNSNLERSYHFKTAPPTPLTSIGVPGFVQNSATPTTINMNEGSYAGDISQNANDGIVQITSNDGGDYQTKMTNLGHDITTGGNYRGATITGLTPGTRYKGRVVLKDYDRIDRYSGLSGYFYTPNTVNQPGVPTLNTPTANNNATADVTATYNAGNVAAHPSQVEVSISTNNSSWTTINTGTTPATTTPGIDTGNKKVSFRLSKLNANTKYYVRYRVKNASGIWSNHATREFTTKGVPVTVQPPKVTNITSVSATAGNSTYTGTVTPNQGLIQYSNEAGAGMVTHEVNNLSYSNGNYGTLNLTGLYGGSKYRVRTMITDSNNQKAWSSWANFVTPTELSDLELTGSENPTTATNGVAIFKGFYKAATNTRQQAAHPNKIQVQIQEVGTTSWVNGTITDQDFVLENKRITFKLKGLKAGAKYNVRYRAENGTNNGAGEIWSDWKVTNNAVSVARLALVVNKPVITNIKHSTATIGNGTYIGNISTDKGSIEYTPEMGAGMQTLWANNLTHSGTVSGSYGTLNVTGLRSGAIYRARAVFKDPSNANKYSEWAQFVTPTTLNRLTVQNIVRPTNATNGEATFSGIYTAATNTRENAAHPNKVRVQIRVNGTTNPWQDISPHGVAFSKSDKKVTFTLKGLAPKTKYDVQYQLENGTNNGPGTEAWSSWYVCNDIVTMLGIQLRINQPSIQQADNASVTATSVQLGTSKYWGDISPIWDDAQFKMMKASETNWLSATTVFTNLVHERKTGVDGDTSNINYNGAKTISGLTPGTKYKGRLTVPDYEGVLVDSPETIFCTALTVNTPTASATEPPLTANTAKVDVNGSYNADAMSPAHANAAEVQISLTGNPNDFTTLVYNSAGTAPSLNSNPVINTSAKTVEFKLKNLKENTTYYVRYRMKNESNKWSDWSTTDTVTTLTRMPGYYFENVPEFNFGNLDRNDLDTFNPLTSTSGSFDMEIENVGMVNNWVLSAKLSPITTFDGSNLELTNAALIVGKKLSNSTDGGATWSDVSSSFNVGGVGTEVLPSNTSVQLWKSPNSTSAQGKFKYTIDRNSVKLKVLGGTAQANREYRGKVTWTMDTLP